MKTVNLRLRPVIGLGLVWTFCFCSGAAAAKVDIAGFLKNSKDAAWTKTAAEFQKLNGSAKKYVWNSKQKHFLHYAANNYKGSLFFLDWPLAEADFDFGSGKLDSMTLNFFNKTCAANRNLAGDKNSFLEFVDQVQAALDKAFACRHEKVSVKLINGARVYACSWNAPDAYMQLKWSYDGAASSNFTAHYLTLYIYRDKQFFDDTGRIRVASVAELDLKSRLKTSANGDRYLEIPMVDQGKRGYCVVACAERILKYYNVNIDQHILAQAAGTSSSGTKTRDIEKSMKSVGVRCKFRVEEVKEFSPIVGNMKILTFIKKYNRNAKRAGKATISVSRVKSYNQLFRSMDEEILIKTMIKYDSGGYKRFQSRVAENIDEGIPVLWGVMLGMVKEPKLPQQVGCHMRLIIGYNPQTEEIIYSDSWGKGHEFKRMSWEKAWTMTQMAHVFIPKKR
ncbi:MAG: C39 family peptidase [Victivallales bacterium]|nr:C39 family peptidase [Victivallales bacterium]